MKRLIAFLLLLALPIGAQAAKRPSTRSGQARRRPVAAAKADPADAGLVDFSLVAFSDQGSHIAAMHGSTGFFNWQLRSASAFGSLAAEPNAAKRLFDMRIELEVAGSADPLFSRSVTGSFEDMPRWSTTKATDRGIHAEGALLYPETDGLVLAANFTNRSKAAIKVRPRLILSGGEESADTQAQFDAKGGVLSLSLDRSRQLQRKFKECVAIVAGAGKGGAVFSAASMKAAENLGDVALVGLGGFSISTGPAAYSVLKPGQALRFPVAIAVAADERAARLPIGRLFKDSALPKGSALSKAKARWNLSSARLPRAADPAFERLARASALTLLSNLYSKRAELKNDMFSAAKGSRDAFFSDQMPLTALGYSELDLGAAEAALLELSSFAAAAPAAVPPYTGDELLLWDAAGLPLHGYAAWELFQRDPELSRASTFLNAFGVHLRNECAWWPSHRDGDGNGMFAYASDDEKPDYLRPSTGSGQAPGSGPALQTYSVGLSSFVAWQMQAASALASAAGQKEEADKLLADYRKTSAALKRNSRSIDGQYEQGIDGFMPYLLGLDSDLDKARPALIVLKAMASKNVPFSENGRLYPWRAYFMLRCLSLWGEQAAAHEAATKLLSFLAGKPSYAAYSEDGQGIGSAGDGATAAMALEMALERYEQEAYLLADSTSLSGRMLQVHSPDGSFYLKHVGLSESKAPYSKISINSLGKEPILADGVFSLRADQETRVQLLSNTGLDISEPRAKQELFKGTKHAELILKAGTTYLVKIQKAL